MAAKGRTVRVSGLPVDISENRLTDKLYIHFLRKRNGGGEISSVTVSKDMPGVAFITFEDSEIALKLAQRGEQAVQVIDRTYNVMVSLHQKEVVPNEVLLRMSVTVDHRKLPEGKQTLLSLHGEFPNVHLTFDKHKDQCIVDGCYTDVQSLSKLILASLETPDNRPPSRKESKEEHCLPLEKSEDLPLMTTEEDVMDKPVPQSKDLDLELENAYWRTESSRYMDQVSPETSTEEKWGTEAVDDISYEDFSLVIDSEIYRYLQKYSAKEYQNILKRHRVEAVDVTLQDITTLYLKPRKTLSDRPLGSLAKAHQDLAHLFQEKESQLRKEQVPKSGISKDVLEFALEALAQRLPKLKIDQDERNLYLVGNKSDVSEAKQFIIDEKGAGKTKDLDSDPLFNPSKPFMFSEKGGFTSPDLPGQSDIFKPKNYHLQDSYEIFKSGNNYQKTSEEEIHNSSGTKHSVEMKTSDVHTYSGFYPQTRLTTSEDIFSVRKTSDSSEVGHVQSHLTKVPPSGFGDKEMKNISPRFFSLPTLDLDRRSLGNSNFISDETEPKGRTDAHIKVTEQKSCKEYKTKRTDSGRELKMAPNFSRDMFTGIMDFKHDTKNTEDQIYPPKVEKGMFVEGTKSPGSGQPHSLPFIKPSMTSNFRPNTVLGTSAQSKVDIQGPKGDVKKSGYLPSSSAEKKAAMMPAYSTESQSFSLSHMDLCGDLGMKRFSGSAKASGSSLRRSNSFSSRSSKDQDKRLDVDLFHRPTGQNVQMKEVFTADVAASIKLWLYLKSLHNTDIDNLTSDLQVKETVEKEKMLLNLRGVDKEKVKECQHGLKSLIARAELDFDSRSLPLSMLGVSDCSDKTWTDFCSVIKKRYNKVKILTYSKTLLILGPKTMCEEVEAMLMKDFHTEGNNVKATVENKRSHNPSTSPKSTQQFASNGDFSDQNNLQDSKEAPPSSMDQTREARLGAIKPDTKEQDSQGRGQGKKASQNGLKKKMDKERDKEELDMKVGDSAANTISIKTELLNTAIQEEAGNKINGEQINPQHPKAFTQQVDPESFANQARNVPGSCGIVEASSAGSPHLVSGGLDLLSCSLCQSDTTNHTGCGLKLCSECQNMFHVDCKRCHAGATMHPWGIRGTMSVAECTITIPGFSRDTTLKIIYDIPNGIQGEGHPCPGAPFKGKRFEAFLPRNNTTVKLVPLLKKAFDKGLTFIVKASSSKGQGKEGERDAEVTWGSIPHKTRIDGGAARNGYPDISYIKRLTEALQMAGVEE